MTKLSILVAMVLVALCTGAGSASPTGPDGLLLQLNWWHRAEILAADSVRYEQCGWGPVDLRSTLIRAAMAESLPADQWASLLDWYDASRRDRMTLQLIQAPDCDPAWRQRIDVLAKKQG